MVLPAMTGAANPVATVVCYALYAYMACIIGVIIMSWFPLDPGGAAYSAWRLLRRVTDPVLLPLRRLIPPVGGVLDLSPLIVIVVVQLISSQIC